MSPAVFLTDSTAGTTSKGKLALPNSLPKNGLPRKGHIIASEIQKKPLFRAAFKFDWRVHFALRRKMLKSPISSHLSGLIEGGRTEYTQKKSSDRRHGRRWFQFRSVHHTNVAKCRPNDVEWSLDACLPPLVILCLNVGTYLSNKGFINLKKNHEPLKSTLQKPSSLNGYLNACV